MSIDGGKEVSVIQNDIKSNKPPIIKCEEYNTTVLLVYCALGLAPVMFGLAPVMFGLAPVMFGCWSMALTTLRGSSPSLAQKEARVISLLRQSLP